jgi:MFS family permease
LKSTGAIKNPFLISLIFNLVNVCSTPISFYTVEKLGRRALLVWGAFGMLICQFIVAIVGVTVGFNHTHLLPDGVTSIANNIPAVNAQIAFIAIFIFFFASTWGPGAWIVIGEIFPLPIRSRGVGLSTASNWLWNTVSYIVTHAPNGGPFLIQPAHRLSPSSLHTWWARIREISDQVYSLFGVVCVPLLSFTPGSSFLRPRVCLLSKSTA